MCRVYTGRVMPEVRDNEREQSDPGDAFIVLIVVHEVNNERHKSAVLQATPSRQSTYYLLF
jgi:hypothetical protein